MGTSRAVNSCSKNLHQQESRVKRLTDWGSHPFETRIGSGRTLKFPDVHFVDWARGSHLPGELQGELREAAEAAPLLGPSRLLCGQRKRRARLRGLGRGDGALWAKGRSSDGLTRTATSCGKARLIWVFATDTNCENMDCRASRSEKCSAGGVREVATGTTEERRTTLFEEPVQTTIHANCSFGSDAARAVQHGFYIKYGFYRSTFLYKYNSINPKPSR